LEWPGLLSHDEYSQSDVHEAATSRYLASNAFEIEAWENVIKHGNDAMSESSATWTDHLVRGRAFTAVNRLKKAEVDFEDVIASRAKGSPVWLMADWWISGPYSRGLDKNDPFQRRPDAIPLTLTDLDDG